MPREGRELGASGSSAPGRRRPGGRDTSSRETSEALGGVGARMRELREHRRISLRELARRVGVTPSLISQIETGKINPSVSSLYSIANALDVPMDTFFSADDTGLELQKPGLISMSEARNRRAVGDTAAREAARAGGATAADQASGSAAPEPAGAPDVPVFRQTGPATPVLRLKDRERICIDGYGGLLVWERLTGAREPGVDLLEIRYEPGASSAQNLIMHGGREFGVVLEGELTLDLAFERYVLSVGDSAAFDSNTPHRLSNLAATPLRALWVVVNRAHSPTPPGDAS